jgi:ATP-binding cassette subfamily B protein
MTKNKNAKNIAYYLKKHKCAVTFYLITVILACVCSAASVLLMANFLSYVTLGDYLLGLNFLIIGGVVKVLGRANWWINYHIYIKYSNIMWKEIAKDLTKRSFELSTSTFSDNNSGAFVQRIMNDPNDVLDKLASFVEILAETITQMIVVVYIISLNWIIGLLYIVMLAICFTVEIFRRKVAKKNRLKTKKINDKTYSLVNEIVDSEKDIKALGLEEKLYETSNESFDKYQKQRSKENITDLHFWNGRCAILEVFGIAVLIIGIYLMKQNILTIASYILLYSYRDNLYGFVWNVGSIMKVFTEMSVSNQRMFSLYDEKFYPAEKFGNIELENSKGKIEFKGVEYAYTEVKENEKEEETFKKRKPLERIKKDPIFKNLSFTIEPNTTVAFVGKSGSGKSTILSLISKLIEVDKGEISIDDINVKELSKNSLRSNISLINQFPYIFDMSIKENLQLVKKDATDEEIWEVLKRASFDEDVKAMPKGINTKVGESGIKLSGGQRQRLAIARALLKETKIILFDESTSSLDNFAQSHIQQSIENMKGQHTIVIVAHRLSTIRNVDRIYFLENGEINASGTFDELFETNEQFKKMFLIENIK